MDPINGIGLEKYAELCAKMNDVFGDKDACSKIARSEGIPADTWAMAHTGWQDRLTDPEDMGKTAAKFVHYWQIALDKIRSTGK